MRHAGRPSWFVRENTDERLHALLHVRQALVGREPVALEPPALRHRPPPADVPAEHLPGALAAWDDWWRDAVALAALEQGVEVSGAPDAPAWARSVDPLDASSPRLPELAQAVHDLYEVVRPGDHSAVVDPVLRAVADLAEEDAHRWASAHEEAVWSAAHLRGLDRASRGSVPYRVSREVAEQVIAERGVDPDLVRASVVLLDVDDAAGTWWREPFPGMVLCSFDAALDERTSRTMMHAAFTARL